MLKVNGVDIAVHPSLFSVGIMDVDDADGSKRTTDATMHRDRIAVKRKLELGFGILEWSEISAILTSMSDAFVNITYPDSESGKFETRRFYTGDRTAAFAINKGGRILWSGLKFNLTEQ